MAELQGEMEKVSNFEAMLKRVQEMEGLPEEGKNAQVQCSWSSSNTSFFLCFRRSLFTPEPRFGT